MSGNDIVDLQYAARESNWRRKGFLEKIYTPAEQASILQSSDPNLMVWKCWSMKESAYKLQQQLGAERIFAPLRFNCTFSDAAAGQVQAGSMMYQTTTLITNDYIYSIAKTADTIAAPSINSCFMIPSLTKQQHYIYAKMINAYSKHKGLPAGQLQIIKDGNGIPFLHEKEGNKIIPVSITHHGRYAAFIIH